MYQMVNLTSHVDFKYFYSCICGYPMILLEYIYQFSKRLIALVNLWDPVTVYFQAEIFTYMYRFDCNVIYCNLILRVVLD